MESNKELIKVIKNLTVEIEKNNNNLTKQLPDKRDFFYFVKRYIQEIIEASFTLFIVMIIMKKQIVWKEFFKIVCIVGIVTLILEEYNINAADNFKQGIYYTIGAIAYSGSGM